VPDRSLEGLILGVDLDGVCADFYGRMREIAAEWFERPLAEMTETPSYGLGEWGIDESDPGQYASLHRFAVSQRGLFKTCPMIPGARRYLRLLSDEGVRIRIITHRLFIDFSHNETVVQTTNWLDEQGIPYRDLCFMKDKAQVGADIYVDDSPENIRLLREQGLYTICFANSTNENSGPPIAAGWEDVYNLVHVRAGELKRQA
jgi:5'(3')-deoxyribonucleotidase